MALRLTHENLPAAYEYLRACEPFRRWKLPEADDVVFRVTRHNDRFGHFWPRKKDHVEIVISEKFVSTTAGLIETMAHEMVHLRQFARRTYSRAEHNAEFKRLAALVCKKHGFDAQAFL